MVTEKEFESLALWSEGQRIAISELKCCGNCAYMSPVHAIAQCGKTGKETITRTKCNDWKYWGDSDVRA